MPKPRATADAEPAAPSPARLALADRRADLAALDAELAEARSVLTGAPERIDAAFEAAQAAERAVRDAEGATSDALSVLRGDASGTDALAAARAALEDARNRHARLGRAERSLYARAEELERSRPWRDRTVRDAAAAVLREEGEADIVRLLDDLEEIEARYASKAKAVYWLVITGGVMDAARNAQAGQPLDYRVRMAEGRFHSPPTSWGSYMSLPSPERDAWEARLAALTAPDAPA